MNLYAKVRSNPEAYTHIADELEKLSKQILLIQTTPVPTDSAAALMFYAAVVDVTKRKVIDLIFKVQQLQAENQKALTSASSEGLLPKESR